MLIGRRLSGRYKVLEVIGGGGMANVYLARDVILERDVAIKILRLDLSNDEELIKRFRREAHSATSLVHPNIVSIYDIGEEDNIYYIVMEYVAGKTLKQYIQRNDPLDSKEALDIMAQLTSAISHAHENHIVHRDIKPHNILIDRDGTVKVTDFGIAIALSSTTITQTNSVLGSVHYLSPEQARGGMATNKSDIYSLGIVLFEMVTGRVPFEGESAVSIALKHLQAETPSPRRWNPSIPQSVENIILKATAKDPFHRYSTVEEMEEDIKTAFHPDRANEKRFVIPTDDEVTKAIPIINEKEIKETEQTIVKDESKDNHKQNDEKNKPKKKNKKNKLVITLVSIFMIIALAAVAAVTIIPPLFLPKDITVPDVSNMEYDKAYQKLVDLGFEINDPIEQDHEEIPEGYVIRTDPKANTDVKEGYAITIYESTGKKKYQFGDYEGRDYEEVKEELYRLGYLLATREYVNDESPPGTILSQSIEPGELVVPSETEVRFEVSQGPPKIVLKDLRNFTKEEVEKYLSANELDSEISTEPSNDVSEGRVISQEPKAGTELVKRDKVKIVYSSGKKEDPPERTVKVQIDIPYQPEEEGAVQQVQILIQDANHSLSDVYETFEIEEPESREIEFTIPYGDRGQYLVLLDGKIVDNQFIPYPEDEQ